ncbi:hypothetical protein DYD21_01500 [Rhodohalobacter sp. SW132]|uniref:flagellar export chaperone FlgN n=1 Tax=Rhodohalobacter sp. SW132 TaxID=2293433 RepID=UPI000E27F438|nr:flagellar export chaperone FlgN [Rhodohalobacter sp. SW132]REL38652.1 hypothetical protein DYD21_01500 [Rhodohalobacter sp. SW132]
MQTHTTYTEPIQQLDSLVLSLKTTSEQLIYVMEEQIQAIISSSPQKIEELTEKQSEIQGVYKKHERAFLDELRKNLTGEDSEITLTNLKSMFPDKAEQIERWKIELSQNTKLLQRKNEQLVDLLEFALNRNANLMHSFYSLFNNKNSHYSPSGQKSEVRSGVAINQEV